MTARSYTGIGTAPAGGATPKTLSIATTATSISGWTDKPWTGMFTRTDAGGKDYCKLTDSKWIFVWRSITDNKVKAAIITFDGSNNPTFGSQTSLTAFTDSTKGPVWVYRVSDTRVLIMSAVEISTFLTYEIQVYDISGTTITAAAGLSLQSVTMASANYDYSAGGASLVVIDENRAVLGTSDYNRNTDSRRYYYGIRFTATQNVGSSTDFGASQGAPPNYEGGSDRVPILISSTKIQIGDSYSVSTIDVDTSSTPVVSNLVTGPSRIPDDLPVLPFGSFQYEDERRLKVLPDNPVQNGEIFGQNNWGFGYYSGVSANTFAFYAPSLGTSAFNAQTYGVDATLMLLSQSGTVHHMLYSENTYGGVRSGLNSRYYQSLTIDTNDPFVTYGERVQLSTGITTSTEGLLGGIIRPNTSATRLTAFEYQTAATAGWYYVTIDVT